MNFLELVQNRYTTKTYNSEKKLSAEDLERLKQIIRLSPSSINSQPWKFVFVEDDVIKNQLAEVSFHNLEKIKQCSHLVVFCVWDDVQKFEKYSLSLLPEGAQGYYRQHIKPLPVKEIEAWMVHQVYLSLGFFLSACASFEIDSTPMEGIQPKAYKDLLKLNDFHPVFAVALGYRDSEDTNQIDKKPKFRFPSENIIQTI